MMIMMNDSSITTLTIEVVTLIFNAYTYKGRFKTLKERIAVNETSPMAELRDVTCHTGSTVLPATQHR